MNTQPTFKVHRSDKRLKDHIIRAFLLERVLTFDDLAFGSIVMPDGSTWKILTESSEVQDIILADGSCPCIISYQLWDDGSCYAVARIKE